MMHGEVKILKPDAAGREVLVDTIPREKLKLQWSGSEAFTIAVPTSLEDQPRCNYSPAVDGLQSKGVGSINNNAG